MSELLNTHFNWYFCRSKCGRKKGSSKDKDSNGNGNYEGTESGKSSPSMDLLAAAGAASSKSSAPVSIESYQDKVNEILSFEWVSVWLFLTCIKYVMEYVMVFVETQEICVRRDLLSWNSVTPIR